MSNYEIDEERRRLKMAKSIATQRISEQSPRSDLQECFDKRWPAQYDPPMRNTEDPMVESPPHYADSEIECIDAMRSSMTREAFSGYCKGNVMKYLWRFEKKGEGTQDLEKARVYLGWLINNETGTDEKSN